MYNYYNGDNIDKDNLMTMVLNKYKNICTKDKWLANSLE